MQKLEVNTISCTITSTQKTVIKKKKSHIWGHTFLNKQIRPIKKITCGLNFLEI